MSYEKDEKDENYILFIIYYVFEFISSPLVWVDKTLYQKFTYSAEIKN